MHGGSICAERLKSTHEVLLAWNIADCDTAVLVVQSFGNAVSGTIAMVRWLRVLIKI